LRTETNRDLNSNSTNQRTERWSQGGRRTKNAAEKSRCQKFGSTYTAVASYVLLFDTVLYKRQWKFQTNFKFVKAALSGKKGLELIPHHIPHSVHPAEFTTSTHWESADH